MSDSGLFKWRHLEADLILCVVRWYLRYALSCHAVEELLREGGIFIQGYEAMHMLHKGQIEGWPRETSSHRIVSSTSYSG